MTNIFTKQGWGRIAPRAAAILVLPALLLAQLYAPNQAYASTSVSVSDFGGFATFDWPAWVAAPSPCSGTITAGGRTYFNPSTTSYFIVHHPGAGLASGTRDARLYSVQNGQIEFFVDPSDGHQKARIKGTLADGRFDRTDLYYDNTNNANDKKAYCTGTTAGDGTATVAMDLNTLAPIGSIAATITTAHNVAYSTTWDAPYYPGGVEFTAGANAPGAGATSCSGMLDVACWVGKAINGVQAAFVAAFSSAASFFANILYPDGDAISDKFDELTAELDDKMGFLLYPAEFFIDLFDAFASTPVWCSTSSCVLDVGELFGGDFEIDFNQLSDVAPALWDALVLFVRGVTVLALIFALRNKYMEVVSK